MTVSLWLNNTFTTDNINGFYSCLGFEEYLSESFQIFPNPNTGDYLHIISLISSLNKEYNLYDSQGNELRKGIILAEKITIPISALSSGVYFLKVGTETRKIIIQN